MKKQLLKEEIREKIDHFFSQEKELDSKDIKKIKILAMRFNIKLGKHRRRFCKRCCADLNYKSRKIRVTKAQKSVACEKCRIINRWKLN